MRQDWRIFVAVPVDLRVFGRMSRFDDQHDRALIGLFVATFDRRARAIRAEVSGTGAAAMMRLRAAVDLEACAAAVAALLPPDPPGALTILSPITKDTSTP